MLTSTHSPFGPITMPGFGGGDIGRPACMLGRAAIPDRSALGLASAADAPFRPEVLGCSLSGLEDALRVECRLEAAGLENVTA